MPVRDIRLEVVRDIVTEYQKARTKEKKTKCFERLLYRIDNLVIFHVHLLCDLCGFLQYYDFNELYLTALVGCGRAIQTTKPNESGLQILGRVRAYVRNEILQTYKPLHKKVVPKFVSPDQLDSLVYRSVYDEGLERVEFDDELELFVRGCVVQYHNKQISMRDLRLVIRVLSGQGDRKMKECKARGVHPSQWDAFLLSRVVPLRRLPLQTKVADKVQEAIDSGIIDFESPVRIKPSKERNLKRRKKNGREGTAKDSGTGS